MENISSEKKDSAFLKMYEIPGYEKIAEHSLVRYQTDKENFPKDVERIPFSLPEYLKQVAESAISKKDDSNNSSEQKKLREEIDKIRCSSQDVRAKRIRQCLLSDNPKMQKECAQLIYTVQEKREQSDLFNLAKQKLGNAIVEPPLYKNTNISNENFAREEFEKTGSDLIVVGGELKNKVIFHSITPDAFLNWQKAYEDHELWHRAGFDYVPIEPIFSFHYNKNGMVDVASGVLDISLRQWEKMSGYYINDLYRQREKIMETLNSLGIIHGHPKGDNFCLRFFRKENGDVDFNKKPRIYLIDFDRAISQK